MGRVTFPMTVTTKTCDQPDCRASEPDYEIFTCKLCGMHDWCIPHSASVQVSVWGREAVFMLTCVSCARELVEGAS